MNAHRLAVLLALLALTPPATARTAELRPLVADPAAASRLRPEPGALGVVAEVRQGEVAPWAHKGEGWSVGAHLRYVALPDFAIGAFVRDHTSLHSVAAGLSVDFPLDARDHVVVELDWTRLAFAPGNWRGPTEPPGQAEYVEVDLQHLSIDVTWRRFAWLAEWMAFTYGAGAGLAVVTGEARTVEVLPSCQEPVAACPHWRQVGRSRKPPPSRILPVIHATVGAHFEPVEDVGLRLEVGFRNVLYVGLWGGWRI